MAVATAVILTHKDSISHEDAAAPIDVLFEAPVESNPYPEDEEPFMYAAAVDEDSSVTFQDEEEDDEGTSDDSAVEDEAALSAAAVSIGEATTKQAIAAIRSVDRFILSVDMIKKKGRYK
jgi:hypothetical protein